jgi:hypothetical protein
VTESTTSETVPIAGGLPVTPGQVNRLVEHFEPEPERDEAMQPWGSVLGDAGSLHPTCTLLLQLL